MGNASGDSGPAREALIGELLGELDAVIKRVEILPGEILSASRAFVEARVALETAGARFRTAANEYAEHVKTDYSRQLKLVAEDVGSRMLSQQRAAMQTVAHEAFQRSSTEAATALAAAMEAATRRIEATAGAHWSLLGLVAAGSAIASAILTTVVLHFYPFAH